MSDTPHICTARKLPLEAHSPLVQHLIGLKGHYWPPGTMLKVAWRGGSAKTHARCLAAFNRWNTYGGANVSFREAVPGERAELRCSFDSGGGSWSNIGIDVASIPANEPTMNLGWIDDSTDDAEVIRTATHEAGHFLGFLHEQLQEAIQALLNREAVIAAYMRSQGWSRQDVIDQVFSGPPASDLDETAADVRSIMEYPFDESLTVNHVKIPGGSDLMPTDMLLSRMIYYGLPQPSFTSPPPLMMGPPTPPVAAPPTTPTTPTPPPASTGHSYGAAGTPDGGVVYDYGHGEGNLRDVVQSLHWVPVAGPPRSMVGTIGGDQKTTTLTLCQISVAGHTFQLIQILKRSG